MKRPDCRSQLFIAIAIIIMSTTQTAISSSDQQASASVGSQSSDTLKSDEATRQKQPIAIHPIRQTKPSNSTSTRQQNRLKKTNSTQLKSSTSHNLNQSDTNQDTSTMRAVDSIELAQDEMRQLAEFRNAPPLFLTKTRDYFVDIARYLPGFRLATMQAIDSDGDKIKYSLKKANNRDASPYFVINATTGELKLNPERQFPMNEFPSESSVGDQHENTKRNSRWEQDADSENEDIGDFDEAEDSSSLRAYRVSGPNKSAASQSDNTTGESGATIELPDHLYFLNVAADDGKYSSVVEFQIHVFNSSSLGTRSAIQLTPEVSRHESEQIEQFMRVKTNEFFERIQKSSTVNFDSSASANATLVYPNFVNPNLLKPSPNQEDLISTPKPSRNSDSQPKNSNLDARQQTSQQLQETLMLSTNHSSDQQETNSYYQPSHQLRPHDLNRQNLVNPTTSSIASPEQSLMYTLSIITCASVIIAFVVSLFIVPLSVRRLRRRLKNVEMQHEQLSHKASNGGASTFCSSGGSVISATATTSSNHLPSSLSQFTLPGSMDQSSCSISNHPHAMLNAVYPNSPVSLAVCRQSSCDSALGFPKSQQRIPARGQVADDNLAMLLRANINGVSSWDIDQSQNAIRSGLAQSVQTPHLGQPGSSHRIGRINNVSIVNPMYLEQQQPLPNGHRYVDPNMDSVGCDFVARAKQCNQQKHQAQYLPPFHHQNLTLRSNGGQDIYDPLEDEFYSTINSDIDTQHQPQHIGLANDSLDQTNPHFVGSLSGHTNDTRTYFGVECAPTVNRFILDKEVHQLHTEMNDRQATGTPDSIDSTKSLARFLSLPARHERHRGQEGLPSDEDPASDSEIRDQSSQNHKKQSRKGNLLTEIEYNLGKSNDLNHKTKSLLNNCVKTIARTVQVERERQSRLKEEHKSSIEQTRGAKTSEKTSDPWELDRHRLRFLNILDAGQFGLVWRCELRLENGRNRIVAVKMLKNSLVKDERERDDLLAEIEIMKRVSNHPNVVKILHCCTRGTDLAKCTDQTRPIYLVMEQVEFGKLQTFLEKSRINHLYGTTSESLYEGVSDRLSMHNQYDSTGNYYFSRQQQQHLESLKLTSRDLIKFIYHVAKGMEYISSNHIVHRDLASRNILVSSEKICKIGDFGMARHVGSLGDVYERRSRNSKVPVRWMAPEVLLHNTFTTKSDVYSFGILMWEIVTLGSTPYKNLKTDQIIEAVAINGQRPIKPDYCHAQLFDIMTKCWSIDPEERPTFESLASHLDQLLLSANEYIELDQYPDHEYCNVSKAATFDELV